VRVRIGDAPAMLAANSGGGTLWFFTGLISDFLPKQSKLPVGFFLVFALLGQLTCKLFAAVGQKDSAGGYLILHHHERIYTQGRLAGWRGDFHLREVLSDQVCIALTDCVSSLRVRRAA
jgi:hypothetical protein